MNTVDGLVEASGLVGSCSALRSIAMDRSTASSVSGWPVRSTSIISSKSRWTSLIPARSPVAVTSLPRAWMSRPGKARSITFRSESPVPSTVTIG